MSDPECRKFFDGDARYTSGTLAVGPCFSMCVCLIFMLLRTLPLLTTRTSTRTSTRCTTQYLPHPDVALTNVHATSYIYKS